MGGSSEAIMSFGRLATSFAKRRRALIYTGGPFQRIYLCVLDLLLLFHLPVLSNQSTLGFRHSLQGRGKAPLLPSTLRDYIPLLSALLLHQDVPLRQSSASLLLFLSFQPCVFNEACLLFSL